MWIAVHTITQWLKQNTPTDKMLICVFTLFKKNTIIYYGYGGNKI